MSNSFPCFKYPINLQGTGNPITFSLNLVTDTLRQTSNQYDTTTNKVTYWSLKLNDWFLANSSLNVFSTYYLCLEIPASHTFLGVIQNSSTLFNNKIVLSASNVNKTYTTLNNGAPCIEVFDPSIEFLFKPTTGTGGATWASDVVTLAVYDQAGSALANTGTVRKVSLTYAEYIQF